MTEKTVAGSKVLGEIAAERARQVEHFGFNERHDAPHTFGHWIMMIGQHLDLSGANKVQFRKEMVQVAALAVAAIEAEDARSNPDDTQS